MCDVIWRSIKGWEGFYEVSNTGLVRSLERKVYNKSVGYITVKAKMLCQKMDKDGYAEVHFRNGRIHKYPRVHRLVAIAFIPNPENKPAPNHLNGIRNDNRVENLEWCTQSENVLHAWRVMKRVPATNKKINQYDLNDQFIKEWTSITEAARALNIERGNISYAAKGKRNRVGQWKWKYAS